MRTLIAAAVSAALLIGLAGCGDKDEPASGQPVTDAPTVEDVEAAPLQAVESETPSASTPEAAYLGSVRMASNRGPEIADATDEQLIAAGKLACEQMAEGKAVSDVRVVGGEQPDVLGYYPISSAIAGSAADHLC